MTSSIAELSRLHTPASLPSIASDPRVTIRYDLDPAQLGFCAQHLAEDIPAALRITYCYTPHPRASAYPVDVCTDCLDPALRDVLDEASYTHSRYRVQLHLPATRDDLRSAA